MSPRHERLAAWLPDEETTLEAMVAFLRRAYHDDTETPEDLRIAIEELFEEQGIPLEED